MTKNIIACTLLIAASSCSQNSQIDPNTPKTYKVHRAGQPLMPDANWSKAQWRKAELLDIELYMGNKPEFAPKVQAKLLYDDSYIYVIFRVDDQYVRAVATKSHGRVWEDSCVEFFFTPSLDTSTGYFNLETNCIGTVLFRHQLEPWKEIVLFTEDEIKQMSIAHSIQRQEIDKEIDSPLTWTLEYRIPLENLGQYNNNVIRPAPGVKWRANFYKCADKTSKPHWLTWSYIDKEKPNFHLPKYFGTLEFTD